MPNELVVEQKAFFVASAGISSKDGGDNSGKKKALVGKYVEIFALLSDS